MGGLRHPHLTTPRGRAMDHQHRAGQLGGPERARAGFAPEFGFPAAAGLAGEFAWFPTPMKRKPLDRRLGAARAFATMLPELPTRQECLQVAETLAIAAVGGVGFSLIG